MTAAEFLQQLAKNLSSLTAEERENALSYYREYLEEAGEDAAAAIHALGSPQSVAQQIILEVTEGRSSLSSVSPYMEDTAGYSGFTSSRHIPQRSFPQRSAPQYNIPPLNETSSKTDGGRIALTIIVLIFTSPFWLTVLIVWASLVFSMAVTLLAFVAAAIAGPIQGTLYLRDGLVGSGLWDIGGGVLCAGLALLLWYPFLKVTVNSCKGIISLSKSIVRSLLGKEGKA